MIKRKPSKSRKKLKVLSIPINPDLEHMLKDLRGPIQEKGYLFPDDAKLYLNGSAKTVSDRIQKHFIRCGIETQEQREDSRQRPIVRVGFHSLRHSFVSLLAADNVPQVVTQELVGHGSPAMTAVYSHAGGPQKVAAIKSLPVGLF